MTSNPGTPNAGADGEPAAPERINGGQALIRSLEHEGVEVILGLRGARFFRCTTPFSIARSVISSFATNKVRAIWPRDMPMPRGALEWRW